MVETLQVQQIMVGQLIRKHLLFLSSWVPYYNAYLKSDYECKYCYTDLQ